VPTMSRSKYSSFPQRVALCGKTKLMVSELAAIAANVVR
jgi:hypothetical protein